MNVSPLSRHDQGVVLERFALALSAGAPCSLAWSACVKLFPALLAAAPDGPGESAPLFALLGAALDSDLLAIVSADDAAAVALLRRAALVAYASAPRHPATDLA